MGVKAEAEAVFFNSLGQLRQALRRLKSGFGRRMQFEWEPRDDDVLGAQNFVGFQSRCVLIVFEQADRGVGARATQAVVIESGAKIFGGVAVLASEFDSVETNLRNLL